MKTVTFYSYKGGVGRSLLLANVAKYLSRFGQKVFVLDFDLEAPGLYYKFGLAERIGEKSFSGIVDYITEFRENEKMPDSLASSVFEVDRRENVGGIVNLMPAGDIRAANYWRNLARIDWHELFFSEKAYGVPFFLEMKERIRQEYKPDYLLIDSRTGITEVGGVATTILPDSVICLLLRNRENLEGAREVMRGIQRTRRLRGQEPIQILPVASRLPVLEDSEAERRLLHEIQNYLNEEAHNPQDTLTLPELSVLHTDRNIERNECLLIEGNQSIEESALLRDYIRLFAQMIPGDVLEPRIGPLVKAALQNAWDDPIGAERDLEALTQYATHPDPFEALIKFYRLRNASSEKILRTANRFWEITKRSEEPFLWQVAKEHFTREAVNRAGIYNRAIVTRHPFNSFLSFIEDVWQQHGAKDANIGMLLAETYFEAEKPDGAERIVQKLLQADSITEDTAVGAINILRRTNSILAFDVISRFKYELANRSEFIRAWATVVVRHADTQTANATLLDENFDIQILRHQDIALYIELLRSAKRDTEAKEVLNEFLISPEITDAMKKPISSNFVERLKVLADRLGLEKTYMDWRSQIVHSVPRRRATT